MRFENFDLEKWYVKYEFSSKYNLSASGVYPLTLSNFSLEDISLNYSEAQGNHKLRQEIANSENVSEDNILITNGAIEGLFLTQLRLIDKGDNIIVIKPTYPALYQIAKDIGANIIDLYLRFENNFELDIKELEELVIKYKPKAIIINYPNNPTGKTLSVNEIKEICKISEINKSYLISDEVYSYFQNDKFNLFNYYSKAIVINSMSKVFRLAGARIGWVIADKNTISELVNLRHYTTLCNNILGEEIAYQAIKNKNNIIESSLNIAQKHKEIALEYLTPLKEKKLIDFIIPDVGVMLFIKLNFTDNAEKFCEEFEKETSILLLPANKYDDNYKSFIRLGFGIDEKKLIYCLKMFVEYIFNRNLD